MKIVNRPGTLAQQNFDLLVVLAVKSDLARSKKAKPFSLVAIDHEFGGVVAHLRGCEFTAKAGESELVTVLGSRRSRSLLVVGWSDSAKSSKKRASDSYQGNRKYRALGAQIAKYARQTKSKRVCLCPVHLEQTSQDEWLALLEGARLSGYSFEKYKGRGHKAEKEVTLKQIILLGRKSVATAIQKSANATCSGVELARDLINTPARDCRPRTFVQLARSLGRTHKLRVQIFDQARLTKLKAGSLMSVADGSREPPYLIKLTYRPRGKVSKVVSFVGKGITFDSGGYSIKPAKGMEQMKIDMSGAAAVFGAMVAIAQLKPKVEVRGYIPTAENMINGHATRPGDVVRAMNGKSIEILNTDAEGRLILADALCMAERDGCDAIVDLATLTGACMVALGSEYAGAYSDDEKLMSRLQDAGAKAGEHLWRMPLAPEYRAELNSDVADLRNIGTSGYGGSITAALFLKEFVDKTPWCHLDIAGPASSACVREHITTGGVGFGVATLVRYAMSLT